MNDKCCGFNCDDSSRNMYSIDYDSLIERLENTKKEIDDTIRILENKKAKDNIINDILSREDEDDDAEAEPLHEKCHSIKHKTPIRYKVYYPYNRHRYPFEFYPWF